MASVRDNVLLPADLLGLDRKLLKDRAEELLSFVNLAGSSDKYPGQLSGGMQQRASIARALLHDPDVLFMDDPCGALDAMTGEEPNVELQRIQIDQHTTVLFVMHSIPEAVFLSTRVLVFTAGPGEVVADISIPLDRLRTLEDQRTSEFGEIEALIRGHLGGWCRAARSAGPVAKDGRLRGLDGR